MPKKRPRIRHADVVERFAARLREVRQARGLTQAELARSAKVTVSYVGRLERGGAAPGIDLVDRLATALGTTAHDLLPTSDPEKTVEVLRERVRELFHIVLDRADGETLRLLAGVLARLR